MFNRNIFILERFRLVAGFHQQLVQPLGNVDLAGLRRPLNARTLFKRLFHLRGDDRKRSADTLDQPRHQPALLLQQGQQHVLGIHLLVTVSKRLYLRLLQRLLHLLCGLA